MLEVRGLESGYKRSTVLQGVDLDLDAGRVLGLLGRNGVGKSTLMKTIVGLLRPRAGRIVLDGRDVTARRPNERARLGVGYVPQGRGIFPYLSVFENLLMGFEAAPGRPADERSATLEEMYALFPVLAEMRGRVAGTLSGGQQQQLAIARALVMRPKLLVLDEPTEGIQPSIIKDIGRAIVYLKQQGNLAILLVEQYLDFARELADTIAVMDRGQIVLSGPARAMEDAQVRRYLSV